MSHPADLWLIGDVRMWWTGLNDWSSGYIWLYCPVCTDWTTPGLWWTGTAPRPRPATAGEQISASSTVTLKVGCTAIARQIRRTYLPIRACNFPEKFCLLI